MNRYLFVALVALVLVGCNIPVKDRTNELVPKLTALENRLQAAERQINALSAEVAERQKQLEMLRARHFELESVLAKDGAIQIIANPADNSSSLKGRKGFWER
jgi:uncharacterized coiled-coil protein SlyX